MFEYDSVKSQTNKSKHGLDFDETQVIWNDPNRVEIQASHTTEPRFMMIGKINGKYWSAIFTRRGATIRLISVRRFREEEVRAYES